MCVSPNFSMGQKSSKFCVMLRVSEPKNPKEKFLLNYHCRVLSCSWKYQIVFHVNFITVVRKLGSVVSLFVYV